MGASVSKQELVEYGLVNPDGTYVNPDNWKTIPVGAATYVRILYSSNEYSSVLVILDIS